LFNVFDIIQKFTIVYTHYTALKQTHASYRRRIVEQYYSVQHYYYLQPYTCTVINVLFVLAKRKEIYARGSSKFRLSICLSVSVCDWRACMCGQTITAEYFANLDRLVGLGPGYFEKRGL